LHKVPQAQRHQRPSEGIRPRRCPRNTTRPPGLRARPHAKRSTLDLDPGRPPTRALRARRREERKGRAWASSESNSISLDCLTAWRSPCWQRSVSFVRPEHRRVGRSPQGRFRRVTRAPRVERVARPGLEHAQAAPGQIYNCGDEHQITTREWVR
jgi:hypothetical protein